MANLGFSSIILFLDETDKSWMGMLYEETSIMALHLLKFDPDALNVHTVNSSSTFDTSLPLLQFFNT